MILVRGIIYIFTICAFLISLQVSTVTAQTPGWVSSFGANSEYSESEFITGFGMAKSSAEVSMEKALSIALNNSRVDLIQKVTVDVNAQTQVFEEETDGNYNSQIIFQSESSSSLQLFGLNSENFVENGTVYVLTNVNKQILYEHYDSRSKELESKFIQAVNNGRNSLKNGNKNRALAQFIEAKPLYPKLYKAWRVARSLEKRIDGKTSEVWTPTAARKDFEYLNQQINLLTNRKIATLEDAVWVMVNNIGSEARRNHRVNVSSFTFEDSGISSAFANLLRQNLILELAQNTSWEIIETDARLGNDPTHLIIGTFWDVGNTVDVILNVRDISTGIIIASTGASIPKAILEENGLELLPDNYEKAVKDLQALKENKGDSRGLDIEVWTTKGQDQLVYEEGELMEVSLQVNVPSYVRILYHLNDGTRVLLTDSHFINDRDVNKPYTLPYQFECVAPFGVEMMQVIAQTEPFERVQTKMVDGVPYLAEDLEEFLSNTRGFKIKKQKAQQAEEVLTITTMSKL